MLKNTQSNRYRSKVPQHNKGFVKTNPQLISCSMVKSWKLFLQRQEHAKDVLLTTVTQHTLHSDCHLPQTVKLTAEACVGWPWWQPCWWVTEPSIQCSAPRTRFPTAPAWVIADDWTVVITRFCAEQPTGLQALLQTLSQGALSQGPSLLPGKWVSKPSCHFFSLSSLTR